VKWILIAILFFALAKATYGDDNCPKKSTSLGFCVQAELMDHAFKAKDAQELKDIIRQDCATEMKEFADCDGIDKSAYVNDFVNKQAEYFKKDRPKAVAHLKTMDSDEEQSTTN
jgi:hypothetical protein